ncbi:4378_t:CDS:2 [Funneliformis mosseae]|uniref:4378_t:CDS:1 n=1 Tax=Funneliformis mosseae TaxID=27381 RepID=A0A9N9DE73_FUNMO|nr:4378_t:CDS:2 [Funneliformis mosseae]
MESLTQQMVDKEARRYNFASGRERYNGGTFLTEVPSRQIRRPGRQELPSIYYRLSCILPSLSSASLPQDELLTDEKYFSWRVKRSLNHCIQM